MAPFVMGLRSGPGSKDSEGDGGGFAASFKEKGRGWRRGLCRRVVFAGAQGATAPAALKVADCRSAAMLIKSALRDLLFCVIGHENNSADWLAALASPYPAAPDFPRKRGQNKTPRNTLFINDSAVCTGYSATVEVLHRTSKWGEVRRLACPLRRFPFAAPPNCGGKVVAPATKGGCISSPARAVVWFSLPQAAAYITPL